jgi:quercetin dioxygenase-like cupin family protein
MSNTQKFSWGHIVWIYVPQQDDVNTLHIGISTMDAHAVQPCHVHCGDEQTLYILSGHGKQRINGEDMSLAPGEIFHIPAGASHESVNEGDEPIVKLLISTPARFDNKLASIEREGVKLSTVAGDQGSRVKRLKAIVEGLRGDILQHIKMPLSIWDHTQEPIYVNNEFSPFCVNCCRIDENIRNCVLYTYIDFYPVAYYSDAYAYVCPYGLSLYNLQIVYKEKTLGYIKAGHVRVGSVGRPAKEAPEAMPYDVPQSTVSGILDTMHTLAEAVSKLYLLEDMESRISYKQEQIFEKQRTERVLKESLANTQDKFLNSQISQHFLFNILNSITNLALKENASQTCAAIGELSTLFRYTVRPAGRLVPLAEELNHVRAYTNLQKLRYGDRLTVRLAVPPELESVNVPFNFLQPIVENCFNHAFRDVKETLWIAVEAAQEGGRLHLKISDNGAGVSPDRLATLAERLETKSGPGGLAMVARKLEALYGGQHRYEVLRGGCGLNVVFEIPYLDAPGARVC